MARAFAVYFHLANLAEEHQRIRNLRERDTGQEPVRESLAAAVAEISRDAGPEHLRELLASLRVHLVLTAHPTEARRRAVVAALRRISGLLDVLDDQRTAAADRDEARRGLREQIDLLWRTSQLRVKAMDPIDEVRTVMTAFDETLFRVVPAVYRELDRAVAGAGRRGIPGAGLPAVRQLGGRGPGRQPVRDRAGHPGDRDDPGRPRAARAGERHDQDRPGADPARGDDAAVGRAAPRAGRGARRAPGTAGRDRGALAAGAVPDLPAVRGAADQRHPGPARRPGLPRPGRVPRRPAHRPAVAGRGRARPSRPTASCRTSSGRRRRSASTWPAWRSGSTARCTPGRWPNSAPPARPAPSQRPVRRRPAAWSAPDRGGAGHVPRGGLGAGPVRRGRVPPLRGELHPLGRRHRRGVRTGPLRHGRRPRAGARRGAAVRERGRPGQRARRADRHARAARGRGAAGGQRPGARGDARLLRLGQGTRPGQRHPAAVRHPGQAGRLGRGQRRPADPVPRPRRRPRPGRRPGRPGRAGPGARLGQRLVQGHRAGRGHLRPVRAAGDRQAAPGAGGLGRAARLVRADRRTDRGRRARPTPTSPPGSTRPPAPPSAAWSRRTASPTGSPGSARWARSAACASARARPSAACPRPAPAPTLAASGGAAVRRAGPRPPWTWPTCARSRGSSPGRRPG